MRWPHFSPGRELQQDEDSTDMSDDPDARQMSNTALSDVTEENPKLIFIYIFKTCGRSLQS